MANNKRALGRGLSALIAENETEAKVAGQSLQSIALDKLVVGSNQPRHHFNEESLKELSESIKNNGLLQPILVQAAEGGHYTIIAGERRWRAAKLAGLTEVPVIVRELDKDQALQIALIENIQREDLTPVEEARAYRRLMEEFGFTQETLSLALGKSRSHIANAVRVLSLPEKVLEYIEQGALTMGHARLLVKTPNPEELAEIMVTKKMAVRQAEKFISLQKPGKRRKITITETTEEETEAEDTPPPANVSNENAAPSPAREKDQDLVALEDSISKAIGLKVSIEDTKKGGKVEIYFNNLSELDQILQRITGH